MPAHAQLQVTTKALVRDDEGLSGETRLTGAGRREIGKYEDAGIAAGARGPSWRAMSSKGAAVLVRLARC